MKIRVFYDPTLCDDSGITYRLPSTAEIDSFVPCIVMPQTITALPDAILKQNA